ncbi:MULTISPECIES: hypothetical protein [unclassified Thioalkalivibrio]|uniref:pilus assembly PilX family protein n=1 Tax=unclassified Thioalkalivibrio TaxID=2621013 RepID=UPI000477C7A7|nr:MULTISPECIES: hypothetical protein [unclassified Thioalkalivibrio]
MNKPRLPYRLRRRQEGIATLLITVVILVAVTLTLVFTAQTAALEQRMSANEVRMKQTSSAAQGGLEKAMAHMQSSSTPTLIASGASDPRIYRATFLDPDAMDAPEVSGIDSVCPAEPANFPGPAAEGLMLQEGDNFRDATIVSCGWSDDLAARKVVVLRMKAGPAMANPPNNPLVARGGLDMRGSASVYNAYENTTIRSGGGVSISGASGTTFTRHRDAPRPSDSDPVPAPGDSIYQLDSQQDDLGLGVIDRDDNFALTQDQFFEAFMGMSKEDFRNTQVPPENVHSSGELALGEDARGQVHWVEGDVRLLGQIGDRDNPVILVVDGDVTARGNFDDFHGVLYVMGDLEATGNPNFYGSAVIEGMAEVIDESDPHFIAGTPNFIFDPVAASGGANIGARSVVSGSWRDWTSY